MIEGNVTHLIKNCETKIENENKKGQENENPEGRKMVRKGSRTFLKPECGIFRNCLVGSAPIYVHSYHKGMCLLANHRPVE